MDVNFTHTIVSSFQLWFEDKLLEKNCYQTGLANNFTAVPLYGLDSNYICYQGEYRQLVADQAINGPNSGFFADGAFITGDNTQTSIYTDYENGRLIVPQSSGSGISFTANSSVREVNVYPANDDAESLLVYSDFIQNGEANSYLFNQTGSLAQNIYITPCCLVSLLDNKNKPFCLGGEEETTSKIRVVVVAKDNYTLDGLIGIFSDAEREAITHVDYSSYPYGIYNDIKSFPYQYDLVATGSSSSLIKKVNASKLNNVISDSILGKNLKIAFIDFDLSTYRYPRL